ncbi:MAG TPA: glycoside hydrolase family 9 protein, partial [Lacipirellulaceae bacterium]|nr:glycoside hydrolase family 9 protein [Lacipirellulaceae bacterium]
ETTGKDAYLRDLEQRLQTADDSNARGTGTVDIEWDWGNVRNLGLFTYLLSKRDGGDVTLVDRLRRDAIRTADSIAETARRHPYARPMGAKHYWGCNGTVARQTMNLHVAHQLTGKPEYRRAMLDAINHLLGRNPFGRSYVTGLGHRPPLRPHDRRSGGDDVVPPWPGYLVGGPWPKPTDWYDVQEDYNTNEIAINWNGALIYALAAFVEPDSFDASIAAAKRATTDSPAAQ